MTDDQPDAGRLLTSGETASMLRVSTDTVLRIPRADLPFSVTPGGHRRYSRPVVARYGRDVLWLDIQE